MYPPRNLSGFWTTPQPELSTYGGQLDALEAGKDNVLATDEGSVLRRPARDPRLPSTLAVEQRVPHSPDVPHKGTTCSRELAAQAGRMGVQGPGPAERAEAPDFA
jgi:hypothetical protein